MSTDQDLRPGVAAVLDGLGAGPQLEAAVEELSPAALTGDDLAAYLRACARQQARADARVFEAMHHLGRARAGTTERFSRGDEFSGDEVAATLCWSRTMASRKLGLADDLEERLPALGQALWEGRIDQARAVRLCEWTSDLPDDLARHVCAVLLPEAPDLPVGELIARIEHVATELDPEWAARRAKRAERNGRLILTANPSGTATLSLCDVSAPSGLAMRDRVDAVAAAVRGLGVLIPVGTLRKDVAERLLDGSMAGLDDHRVALILAAEYHARDGADGDDPGSHEPDGGPGDDGPDDDGPDDTGPGDGADRSGPDDSGDDDSGPEDIADDPAATQGALDLPGLPGLPEKPSGWTESQPFPPTLECLEPGPGRVRAGIGEVRLRLTTAMGLDDVPGSVPGYGTVLAGHARALLARYRDGEWRVVCTDDQGRLQHVLIARRRPHPRPPGGSGQPCRAIVELQVPTTLLAALIPTDHGAWAPLLSELRRRLADLSVRGGPPAETSADAVRRLPRVEIARWVRVRDRCCVAPACRRPARTADIDHTRDHAAGGPSLSWNLGVLDRHHHRAKHHGGWTLRQPSPGRFEWRTRAGVHHTTTPRKVLEAPVAPRPAVRPRPLPDDPLAPVPEDDPDWRRRYLRATGSGPSTRTPPPPTRPAVHPEDDPPPF
ncbi:DUF222 domain-containing protein [Actinomycetospora sp. CA-101289]|uniref:HNH endonuclease signature motif containing protein n=1 Tax=Actinomycetospora sp. CA-101289 TaxID=3239893 RepID=UPI003D97550A